MDGPKSSQLRGVEPFEFDKDPTVGIVTGAKTCQRMAVVGLRRRSVLNGVTTPCYRDNTTGFLWENLICLDWCLVGDLWASE